MQGLCGWPTESNLFHIPESQKYTSTHSTTSAIPETISTTQSLPNPMSPSHNNFLPHEEELFSVLQSQQCSTSTDCITIRSTTGLSNLNMQQSLYENKTEQLLSSQYDMEKELTSTELPGFEWPTDSQQCNTPIHCPGSSDLNMQDMCKNQNEQEDTNQHDLEKELQYKTEELSSKELLDLEEWLLN